MGFFPHYPDLLSPKVSWMIRLIFAVFMFFCVISLVSFDARPFFTSRAREQPPKDPTLNIGPCGTHLGPIFSPLRRTTVFQFYGEVKPSPLFRLSFYNSRIGSACDFSRAICLNTPTFVSDCVKGSGNKGPIIASLEPCH